MNADITVGRMLRITVAQGHVHIERVSDRRLTAGVVRELQNLLALYRKVSASPILYATIPDRHRTAQRLAERLGFRPTRRAVETENGTVRVLCYR